MSRLNVTLTETSSPYLSDELPLRGEITLSEIDANGSLIPAMFRALNCDGTLDFPVKVGDPVFTYDPDVDSAIWTMRQHAERAQAAGWAADGWTTGYGPELRCPECKEPLRLLVTGAAMHSGDVCSTMVEAKEAAR